MSEPHQLSGLELLQEMMQGTRPRSPMAALIPMTFTDIKKGYVRSEAQASEQHSNPLGGVHGGFAATVLDSVTGCAIHTELAAGVSYATIDLQVKMLRPVPKNTKLIAEGRAIHLSRRLGTADGTLKTEDGKLLATATATCFIQRPES